MNLVNKITINTISQLIGRGIIVILSLLTTMMLRRYLGLEGYGSYVYLMNLALLFVAFTDMGTHLTSVSLSAKDKQKQASLLGNAVILRTLLILATSLLMFIFIHTSFFPKNLAFLKFILIGFMSLLVIKETLVLVLHAYEKLYFASLVQVISTLFQFIVVGLAIINQWNLGLILSNTTTLLFLLSCIGVFLLNHNHYFKLDVNLIQIKNLFLKAVPLGGILILFTIYSRLDTLLIEYFQGIKAVGVYGLSYKIYDNLVLPAAFLLNALLPKLSRLTTAKDKQLKKIVKKTAFILIGFSVVIIIVILLTAPIITQILVGQRALEEALILRILAFSLIFAYLNHLTGYLIICLGKQSQSLKIALIALAFNLLANWLFLPIYGMVAAAVITIATEILVLISTGLIIKSYFKNYETA
jgi:O-antigen/teichoic acid export membrane protein